MSTNQVLEIKNVKNFIGNRWVHDGLNFTVNKGEIIAIIGPSGCGKTTLLRSILMLRKPTMGSINVFGIDVVNCSDSEAAKVRSRWGIMFQSGALFSALTVVENVIFPLSEYTDLTETTQREIALLKIALVGLDIEASFKYPAELSGGMKKRAAMARAMALDPELLFLDEPTAGLDPESAGDLDQLILYLRDHLGITFVIVTHDLDTLWHVPDKILFIGEGKVLAFDKLEGLMKSKIPLIKDYFSGPRAQFRYRSEKKRE